MLKWFKSLLGQSVEVARSHTVLSQDGGTWELRQLERVGGSATVLDVKGSPELRRRIHAATSGTPFIYDEQRYASGIPTQEAARLLLEDFESGLAIPHTLSELGWKERLESIAAGRPVDPSFWQR